ncbi:hypothetical protein I4U23_027239 [Adineta vaga]|nr:hypothetical protein I4U23_027239 [Adineta vaga]
MCSRWLFDFNLFETNAIDYHSVRLQRWSTRLYLLIFSFAILILSIYASLEIINWRIEIQNPTFDLYEQLENKYSIECICSDVSISYGQFIQLIPTYHQVCSSQFITNEWINLLFNPATTPFYHAADFRSTGSQQFQLLAILCRTSAQSTDDNLRSFLNTELISEKLLSQTRLIAQIQADINAFQVNGPDAFFYTYLFIQDLIIANDLVPAIETVLLLYAYEYPGLEGNFWHNMFFTDATFLMDGIYCDCTITPTCSIPGGFFSDHLYDSSWLNYAYSDIIDGWYTGCRPMDSLVDSTLKSFYNQTFLNSFLQYFTNSSVYFPSLDIYEPTIFDSNNTTIANIVKANFIEKWTQNITYTSYFDQCAPKSCAYTINKRFNIVYIIVTLLGLYGGLSIALRFITPIIIKFLFRRKQSAPMIQSSSNWLQRLYRSLYEINLFKSAIHVQPSDINQQQWSTRFYIFFLSFTLTIITVYTTVTLQIIQINLINPSLNTVLNLQQQDGVSEFQCPCSQLSVSIKYFIELNPTYHEICSSDFVSENWIKSLTSVSTGFFNDFRVSGPMYRLLQSYCQLANDTVNSALRTFYETQFVKSNLITPDLFASEMASLVNHFKLVIPNRFSHTLQLIRETTQVNQFATVSRSNFDIHVDNETGHLRTTLLQNDNNGNSNINGYYCSAIIDRECRFAAYIRTYDQYGNPTDHWIPGIYTSIYWSESLSVSELICFYNQSCIDNVVTLASISYPNNFTALSRSSQFSINGTFALLINNLFIESWNETFSYATYFEQCQSRSCSYTINQRPTINSVITTVIGLFGGLSVLFRFISPFIVTFIFTYCRRHGQSQEPSPTIQRKGCFRIRTYLVVIWKKVRQVFDTLNLFENVNKPSPPEDELHAQRQWTRVYILILISTISIIVLVTLFTRETKTITINKPTLEIYKDFRQSVDCLCTNLSIPYYTFIDLNPSFHDICSSDFIMSRSDWTTMIYKTYLDAIDIPLDFTKYDSTAIFKFQGAAVLHFQALQGICMYSSNGLVSAFGMNWYPVLLNEMEGIIYMKPQEYNQWYINVSNESYFYACQPKTCSYILSNRFNLLYVTKTVLVLYGGLSLFY